MMLLCIGLVVSQIVTMYTTNATDGIPMMTGGQPLKNFSLIPEEDMDCTRPPLYIY
jgi:hypothetical protein